MAKGSEAAAAVRPPRVEGVAVRGDLVRTTRTPVVIDIVRLEEAVRRVGAEDHVALGARAPPTPAKRPRSALTVARQQKPNKGPHRARPAPEANNWLGFC